MSRKKIQEAADEVGLTPRTIRYYEELGLLGTIRRGSGGRRSYGPDEMQRLRFIQRLKAVGLSLDQIRELNSVHAIGGSTQNMLRRLDALLEERLSQVDERIREMNDLRDEIDSYRAHIAARAQALAERRESA